MPHALARPVGGHDFTTEEQRLDDFQYVLAAASRRPPISARGGLIIARRAE
ncbi:MAG: hypothetical protein ACREF4_17345 [Gammaproteobacteria bacterium]